MSKKKTVTACVTSQKNCEKIILTAKDFAEKEGCRLEVLSIQKSGEMTKEQCEAIDYLYGLSKDNGAQMTVKFCDDPAECAISFLKKRRSGWIFTGIPGKDNSGFIKKVCMGVSGLLVSMISDDGKVYSCLNVGRNRVQAASL
ncbi:MAG: hypothetical protein IJL87_00115 [Clostridia bacterium]|nr:hypothetical protein [Clostridia bacterium]